MFHYLIHYCRGMNLFTTEYTEVFINDNLAGGSLLIYGLSIPPAELSFISISIPLRNMNQDQSYNKRISANLSTLDTIPDYPLTYRCLHECWKSVCKCR